MLSKAIVTINPEIYGICQAHSTYFRESLSKEILGKQLEVVLRDKQILISKNGTQGSNPHLVKYLLSAPYGVTLEPHEFTLLMEKPYVSEES